MPPWLTKSKNQFQEQIFDFLWRQWNTLGVAGVLPSKDPRIIDPEALLLFSLSVCRYEPRLFDEIIDWLFASGHFINVQRLQQIQLKYHFYCGPQLSAIARLLSKKSTYRLKWSGLAKKYYQHPAEPLFFDKDGGVLPCPQDQDAEPNFLTHGLLRGQIQLRGYSQPFDIQHPACLLLRLRALLGIHARAEIVCLLASTAEIHPSQAARMAGYYQKTVQTTLVEMAQSGVVLTRTSRKEKFYRLAPGTLDALLKPSGQPVQWLNWPPLLKSVEMIWRTLCGLSGQDIDSLLLYSELKKQMALAHMIYSNVPTHESRIDDDFPMDNYEIHFQKYLEQFSSRLFF